MPLANKLVTIFKGNLYDNLYVPSLCPCFNSNVTRSFPNFKKTSEYAEKRKIDPQVLVNSRLYPDMFPLLKQVQHVSDTAKACTARLADMEPPSMPDNETCLLDLTNRVDKTIEFLNTLKKEQFDGTEEKIVAYKHHGKDLSFRGLPYGASYFLFPFNQRVCHFAP